LFLEESLSPEERRQASQDKHEAGVSLGQVLRVNGVRLIIVFSGITFLAFAIFQSSFPLTASRNAFPQLDTEDAQFTIALLLSWMGFLIVVVQARLVGPAVRRFGERRLVVFGALIRILAFLGIAIAHSPWVMALSFVPLALGNGVSQPSLQSLISRYAPPSMRGEVLGVFQSTQSLALIFGPLMAGPLLQQGPSAPQFVATGLIAVASLLGFQILKLALPSQERPPAQAEMAPAG
jgi:MFS family permease